MDINLNWFLLGVAAVLTVLAVFLWAAVPIVSVSSGLGAFGIAVTVTIAALALSALHSLFLAAD